MSESAKDRYARELEKKAEHARRKLDQDAARQIEPAPPPPTSRNDGPGTWWQLVPKWPVGIAIAAILATFDVPLHFHTVPWAAVLWGWAVLWIGLVLVAMISLVRFRGFRRRLPFQLSGWERLVSGDVVTDRENWRSLAIEVVTAGEDPLVAQAVASALTVFAVRANRRFYETATGIDHRTRWTASGMRASGSANARVIWCVYRLLDGEISRIASRVGPIGQVRLKVSTKYEHVSEEIDSSP